MWKKDGWLISVGETKYHKDSRFNLTGHNLVIYKVVKDDSGEYVCELETFGAQSLEQVHSVQVQSEFLG